MGVARGSREGRFDTGRQVGRVGCRSRGKATSECSSVGVWSHMYKSDGKSGWAGRDKVEHGMPGNVT